MRVGSVDNVLSYKMRATRKSARHSAEQELLAMKLRRENTVSVHKTAQEEYRLREAIKAADQIRNYQNQYGILLESNQRLPIALQGPSLQRMRDLGNALKVYYSKYPMNFPRGPSPNDAEAINNRRRLN